MTNDQKAQLERESYLAEKGRQVLENEVFQMAFTARKAKLFDVFCNSKADETARRDEAWREMQNLMALEKHFATVLQTGKLADQSLKQLNN